MKTSGFFVALALVALLAACGGDDDDAPASSATGTAAAATHHDPEQAVRDYFNALAVVMEQAAADWEALDAEKASAFGSPASEAEVGQAAMNLAADYAAKAEKRRDGITNVRPQPPASLQGLHLALGAAADDELVLARDIGAILTDEPVADEAGYDALVTDIGSDVVRQRFVDACAALQGQADIIEYDVELHCGG